MRWARSTKKGDLRWFRILGRREVGYLDFIGSGAETIAHARENGRIVVMFCSFEGPPKIVRLYGRASVVLPDDPGFAELAARFDPPEHAVRSVIRIQVERIADSCGFGVPLMRFDGNRGQYEGWVDKKVRDGGFDEYIAGLVSVTSPRRFGWRKGYGVSRRRRRTTGPHPKPGCVATAARTCSHRWGLAAAGWSGG